MSIINMITRNCTQTAVYWATPVKDGRGTFTYTDPVEIKCRWEARTHIVREDDGAQQIFGGEVFILQDVVNESLLYLGTLDDLDSDQEDDPTSISGICKIEKFEKIPILGSTTEFKRKAYLTLWGK